MNPYQYTIKKPVYCRGIGLHSGKEVNLTIKPAEANSGICFVRSDIDEKKTIPAFMDRVSDTTHATTLSENKIEVATTEHLLAALRGMGIDNAAIELDAAEIPIMDGSANPFVLLLEKAGLRQQKSYRKALRIVRKISYHDGDSFIHILPHEGCKISAEIDFHNNFISRQGFSFELTPNNFTKEIATARTFGFAEEVDKLWENGLALGGSLDNAVVIDRTGVVNLEGLRFDDEFVRHKVLDLIGDLSLLGCPLLGHVIAYKPGHGQHLGLMREIAANPDNWEIVELNKNGQHSALGKMFTSTKAASTKFLPFLVPATPASFATRSCHV